MTRVSDAAEQGAATAGEPGPNLTASLAVAVLAGIGLATTARIGATALVVAIAVTQGVLVLAWVAGTALPGRRGAVVVAALASAGGDVCVSVWPGSRLGTLLIVFALAVPVMFVHQLIRGAARTRVVESLGGIGLLVLAVTALPALLQLRHEFGRQAGPQVVFGVVVIAAGALVVGYLVDLVVAAPRFDPDVPRGLLAVAASTGLGGSLGYLLLQSHPSAGLQNGRGAFLGAALGALIALFAVATAFVEHNVAVAGEDAHRVAARARPVLAALAPIAWLAPIGFLLCLALRA